jgi:cation:H+ antiporter
MLTYITASLAGFVLLVWGADRFVIGASGTARALGVPPILIGLTIVALATSAPEILVAIMASLNGETDLAVGNAVGSNIANIALVLGTAAAITPIVVRSTILRREMPALLAVTLLMVMLFLDNELSRIDGLIMLGAVVLLMFWIVTLGMRAAETDPFEAEIAAEIPTDLTLGAALAWLAVGLAVMLAGSHMLVWAAHNMAVALGVSDLVIGLTVVAVGTSIPELAVSIVSALKREHGIVVGNIIGSNMFNSLAVIGVGGVITPAGFGPDLLTLHLPVMIALTLVLFAMTYNFAEDARIARAEGFILLAVFIAYHSHILNR